MEGTPANRGIQFQALRLLFETVKHRQHQYDFELSVSAVEIYNEMPRDLFVETEIYRQNRKLELREDQNGHVFIPNLTTFHIESLEEVYDYLEKYAYKNRQMAHTNSNEVSSRSHCLLFVNITATNKKSNEVLNGKLILIDLAGSERVKKSNAAGQTLNEAKVRVVVLIIILHNWDPKFSPPAYLLILIQFLALLYELNSEFFLFIIIAH